MNLNPLKYPSNETQSFFFFIFFFFLFPLSLSDPRTSQVKLFCDTSKPRESKTFIPLFVKEMEAISQLITEQCWGIHHVINTTTSLYSLAQCHQDLSHTECLLCYAASRTRLPRCLPYASARLYLDGCFVRYDSYNFYSESTDPLRDSVNCSSKYDSVVDEVKKVKFVKSVAHVIENATRAALEKGGFGMAEVKGVYALAQCWNTLGIDGCRKCLEEARKVRDCAPKREGRALIAGCYLRYSTHKFYNEEGVVENHGGHYKRGAVIAIVLAAAAFLVLCLCLVFAVYAKFSKLKEERSLRRRSSITIRRSALKYKYETLEKATDYFNPSRKIGQGGGGSVYIGILPNGEVVAVKRLVFSTRQWVDELFNEVNLISGIQHKNLVKLLGCSIEGPESLLVYEYVPNRSLDRFLFENRIQNLSWKQRFNVIVGTAEGLAYLHEGTETRIIHRDIKSSNVLLDENLTPKIADFGLVRCFAADKTHLSTRIAGTLGYMAPEYLVRGQLSDKADVYSFGVLVLEIVCGRRNNASIEDSSGALLHKVWKLYKLNRLVEAVDPCLGDDFPSTEALNVLQIGLLCTQASVASRPSMSEVVCLLRNKGLDIPKPNQPPFLNNSVLGSDSSVRSCITNSFTSNALKKIEASSTFTESPSHNSNGASRWA